MTGEGQTEVSKKTHKELRDAVAKFAAAMRAMGITKGDRVVGKFSHYSEASICQELSVYEPL